MLAQDIPRLPRDIELHFDKVRKEWVLLASKRALTVNATGYAVLSKVDGERTFGQIADELTQKFDASQDRISTDISDFLDALKARRFLDIRPD